MESRRNAFFLCVLHRSINSMLLHYKQVVCPAGSYINTNRTVNPVKWPTESHWEKRWKEVKGYKMKENEIIEKWFLLSWRSGLKSCAAWRVRWVALLLFHLEGAFVLLFLPSLRTLDRFYACRFLSQSSSIGRAGQREGGKEGGSRWVSRPLY